MNLGELRALVDNAERVGMPPETPVRVALGMGGPFRQLATAAVVDERATTRSIELLATAPSE
jgi:hypothetical protein